MTAAGVHTHLSVRPGSCGKCGQPISYGQKYVHAAKKNYHVSCYVDGKGSPIYPSDVIRKHPANMDRKAAEFRDKQIGAFVREQLRLMGRARLHWKKTVGGLLILSDRDVDEVLEK